jgi:hypothetical protein
MIHPTNAIDSVGVTSEMIEIAVSTVEILTDVNHKHCMRFFTETCICRSERFAWTNLIEERNAEPLIEVLVPRVLDENVFTIADALTNRIESSER